MNLLAKQKETHRLREWTYCCWREGWGEGSRILTLSILTAEMPKPEAAPWNLRVWLPKGGANNAFSKNISNALGVRHRPCAATHTSPIDNDWWQREWPRWIRERSLLCLQPLNRLQGLLLERAAGGFEALEKFKWQSFLKDHGLKH